jgi:hypothetical protein
VRLRHGFLKSQHQPVAFPTKYLQFSALLEYPLAEVLDGMPPTRSIPLLLAFASAFAAEWRPIDPAELAQKTPTVEADADSEVIFWDVHIKDGQTRMNHPETVLLHYRRIKVFNTRGRNFWSTVTIPYPNGTYISEIAARTVHPDGTSVDLDQHSIRETVNRIGNKQNRSILFAMPSVEAGSLIDYHWTESREGTFAHNIRLDFQLDNVPIRIVRYWVKPYSASNFAWTMHRADFHCSPTEEHLADGAYLMTLGNVSAFHREPRMPPEDQVRAWALIYYAPSNRQQPLPFWDDYRKRLYTWAKSGMKADRLLRTSADGVVANDKSLEGKLNALADFCRSRIRNTETGEVSAQERAEAQKNKSPADTLAQGMGTWRDITFLFAALASAEGYDARYVLMADRNGPLFDVNLTDPYFLRHGAVAVKLEGGWRFYDFAVPFLPHDMIDQGLEGVPALFCDPREPMFVNVPTSSAKQTVARFRGSLRLSEDGSIEGRLEEEYTGHNSGWRKRGLLAQSDVQRQEAFKREIATVLSTAEVSDVSIENAGDPEKPLTYRCHVRLPAYAQRAGKRVFFVPDVFRQNAKPVFTATTRKNPVYFPYAETQDDEVTIEIPSDFDFEAPRVPAAIRLGSLGEYEVRATIQSRKKLVYTRRFVISQPGGAVVPAESYAALKSVFGAIANADSQMFTITRSVTPSADHQ